jgi:hypothetical protein
LRQYIEQVSKLSVPQILELDKDNYEIPHYEISSVKIKKESVWDERVIMKGRFIVKWKRKDRFGIMVTEDFNICKKIVETYFPNKLK